jgi:hypothetical protein
LEILLKFLNPGDRMTVPESSRPAQWTSDEQINATAHIFGIALPDQPIQFSHLKE